MQLHLCSKQNGRHRAEIAKLLTHMGYRRKGIGRALMLVAEKRAKAGGADIIGSGHKGRDPASSLYTSLEYIQAGRIPDYAQSANGDYHPTIYYYKKPNGGT
ncbi:GNAT family N-acetyltransferase [Peribacillus muralis]|uniref:GNAT family N-acetyltransferase n=1 Tax=Peribacillus muralis TaxID=264697 RepID=UPI0031F39528